MNGRLILSNYTKKLAVADSVEGDHEATCVSAVYAVCNKTIFCLTGRWKIFK